MATRQLRCEDYTVGWVCALAIELAAAQEMLDEEHKAPFTDSHDTNIYTCGRIGDHNVVVACLPEGQQGTNSAAAVAIQLKSAFPSTQFGLMVGIGGGVPSGEADIRLGDVVISKPFKTHGGVVQYDAGKATPSGFERTGSLNTPPTILLNAVANLHANHLRGKASILKYLAQLEAPLFQRDAAGPDELFEAAFKHVGGSTCANCSKNHLVRRPLRDEEIVVHYGTIASGNQVIRDGVERDRLSDQLGGVLCFEMEAAGLMNSYPCLVIRGVCDYADSHQNNSWQGFAAGTAAACAKEVLSMIPPQEVTRSRTMERTTEDMDKNQECVKQLRRSSTDPRQDKKRIEATKGGLLKESYRWILDTPEFQNWRNEIQSRILWIKGDPGKGKTMLLCGVIDELRESELENLSFFFCQSTDSRINNATAVIKGLIYLLLEQQPSLISHVRSEYDKASDSLFEDANSWFAISDIFKNILQEQSLGPVCLVIDALDECVDGLSELLDLVVHTTSSTHVKWLLSSRNELHVEQRLKTLDERARLGLEITGNAQQVSRAVEVFIDNKISSVESLEDSSIRDQVRHVLHRKADGTFLWVALVIHELQRPNLDPLEVVKEVPKGLHGLYDRMLSRIQQLRPRDAELCQLVLSITTLALRPLFLAEIGGLCGLDAPLPGLVAKVRKMIALCGSFLTVRDDRVYLIHQSAKDYLNERKTGFPSIDETHNVIFSRSMQVLSTLQRDMYQLKRPGISIEEITTPHQDPLAAARYPCVYWLHHLSLSNERKKIEAMKEDGAVYNFFRRQYLYWLEALSLCMSVTTAVISLATLESELQLERRSHNLVALVRDARRFLMSHQWVISNHPLQIYASALLFSPTNSLIRQKYAKEGPDWIDMVVRSEEGNWSACLHTLQGHTHPVFSSAFSQDSARLVSASYDGTIKIWDTNSGACLQTLGNDNVGVTSVAFCSNSTRVVSSTLVGKMRLWDANSGLCLQNIKSLNRAISTVAFSHDSKKFASTADDGTVQIWDAQNGTCLQTLKSSQGFIRLGEGYKTSPISACFSDDSSQLVSTSADGKVKVWDLGKDACLRTFELNNADHTVELVAFTHDSTRVVAVSNLGQACIWDVERGSRRRDTKGSLKLGYLKLHFVVFSPDSTLFATHMRQRSLFEHEIMIRDASSDFCLLAIKLPAMFPTMGAFSHDSKRYAMTSGLSAVKIWDIERGVCLQYLEGHGSRINGLEFSNNSERLAMSAQDHTVKIWDVSLGTLPDSRAQSTRQGLFSRTAWERRFGRFGRARRVKDDSIDQDSSIFWMKFSADSTQLAVRSNLNLRFYDVRNGSCIRTIAVHADLFENDLKISHDFTRLALINKNGIKIMDTSKTNMKTLKTIQVKKFKGGSNTKFVFSYDSTKIAFVTTSWFGDISDAQVCVCDVESGVLLQQFSCKYHYSEHVMALSSDSSHIAIVSEPGIISIFDVERGSCIQKIPKVPGDIHFMELAFSYDSRHLACYNSRGVVTIRDTQNTACLWAFSLHRENGHIEFNIAGTHLHTDIGTISLDSSANPGTSEARTPQFQGLNISPDGVWIKYNSEKLLWLPTEHRPVRSAVSGNTVAIGRSNGTVMVFRIDEEKFPSCIPST